MRKRSLDAAELALCHPDIRPAYSVSIPPSPIYCSAISTSKMLHTNMHVSNYVSLIVRFSQH